MQEYTSAAAVDVPLDTSLADAVTTNAPSAPDDVVFTRRVDSRWTPVTAKEFATEVAALAAGLVASGVQPGDRVGLMSKTRYEWTLVDYAVWTAGAVTVPVYETSSAEQVQWNLSDSGAVAVVVESAAHQALLDEVRDQLPALTASWQIDAGGLEELAAAGREVPDTALAERRATVSTDSLATIIYTSGTTGRPKGCELTHGNLLGVSRSAGAVLPQLFSPEGATLLFLPLAHVFARFVQVACVETRVKMGHTTDIKNLLADFGTFQPTFILSVPRVFEKVYNSARQKAHGDGKGAIFDRAEKAAVAYSEALDAGGPSLALRLEHALFDRLVYSKLRAAMGGRSRYAFSGGAPLGARLGHFFRGIGLTICEGYGLTETSAPTHHQHARATAHRHRRPPRPRRQPQDRRRRRDPHQGRARLPRLLEQPRRHRRGPAGRLVPLRRHRRARRRRLPAHHRPQEGAASSPPAARTSRPPCSRTGCAPRPDQPVHGRRRPEALHRLPRHPRRRRPRPVAQVASGKPELTLEQAATDPDVLAEVQKGVDDANKAVSKAEAIRKFAVLPVAWTEEGGQMTPSLKLKRAIVMKESAADVEALYSGGSRD